MATNEDLLARLDALERKIDAAAPWVADPAAVAAVERLVSRLERIEGMVEALGTLAARLPVVADAAGTTAAWAYAQAEARGIDPIATGQDAAELGLELAKPENLALVRRLLANRPALVATLDAVESVKPDELAAIARDGAALASSLAAVLRAPELRVLLAAGPAALGTASSATTALVEAGQQPVESVGLFGALGKMSDPDVQRAVGFSLALAKRFGQRLAR
ncbi:MAG: DUF1641 domain-containing protein [Myxococcota bacterium]